VSQKAQVNYVPLKRNVKLQHTKLKLQRAGPLPSIWGLFVDENILDEVVGMAIVYCSQKPGHEFRARANRCKVFEDCCFPPATESRASPELTIRETSNNLAMVRYCSCILPRYAYMRP
jgi:hypothetical protein